MSLEDTQNLINGAAAVGFGRSNGLSDDDTIDAMRQAIIDRSRKHKAEKAAREGNRAAAEQFLADDTASFQTKGRNRTTDGKVRNVRVDEDYPDPFGSYEERIYDDDGNLRETRRAEEDFQTYSADEADRFGIKAEAVGRRREADPGLLQERGNYVILNRGTPREKRYWREGLKVTPRGEKGADTRAQRPARDRLFTKPENAAGSRRPDFAKGSQRDIRIAPNANSANDAIAETRAAREASKLTVEKDQKRFNPAVRAQNDKAAFDQSQEIARARFGVGGKGALADENIGYIQEVRSLGTAGPAGHGFSGNYQVVTPNNVNNFGIASPLTRGDEVVGYYGDVDGDMVELGEINTPGTKNALNVPEFTPGQEWVVTNRPNMATPGGTSFGMPQVNIKEQIGMFGDRMRAMGMGMEGFGNPRSLPEFEAAVASIIARSKQQGKPLFGFDEATGKNVVSPNPGIDEVLYGMRYSANEKQALANALLQLDTSLTRNVNLDRKEAFLDRRPQQLSEQPIYKGVETTSTTPLEKIKNEKVGRGKNRKSVGPELRKLNEDAVVKALKDRGEYATEDGVMLPNAARQIAAAAEGREDAKRPFYGAVAGEGAPRAQFIRGTDRGKSLQELQSQFGEEQGRIAFEVEQRYLRDEAAKASRPTIDLTAERMRASDRQGRFEAEKAAYEMEVAELQKIESLMTRGAQQPGQFDLGTIMGGRPRVIPAAPAGRKLEVPAEESFPGGRKRIVWDEDEKVARHLQITDPTPKTPGSWMGGPGRGSVVSAWDKSPNPVPTQPIQEAPVAPSIAPDPWASRSEVRSFGSVGDSIGDEVRVRKTRARPGKKPAGPTMRTDGAPRTREQRADQILNTLTQMTGRNTRKDLADLENIRTNPKYQTGRRIGYGTAALATILGLSNMGNEEEDERYYG